MISARQRVLALHPTWSILTRGSVLTSLFFLTLFSSSFFLREKENLAVTLNLHKTTAEGVADTGRCCHLGGKHCRIELFYYGYRRAQPQRDQADRAGVFLLCCMRARSRPPSVLPLHPAHEMIESDGAASTVSECVQNRRCFYTCAHPGMHNLSCRLAVLTSFGFASGFASALLRVFHWPRPLHITAESTRGQGGVKE